MPGEKKVADRKLYDLLGVDPTATPDDIRKAYRKKALQLHPDKRGNDPEAQEQFTRMKHAYDILSDQNKRDIYDSMGEDGVKVMEDFSSLDAETLSVLLMRSFLASSHKARCLIFFLILLIIGFFTLFPILLCLWLDGIIQTTFAIIMIPVWIMDAIGLWCVGFTAATPEDEEQAKQTARAARQIKRGLKLTKAAAFILLQVFVTLRVDHAVYWHMWLILSPWYFLESIILLEKLVTGFRVIKSLHDAAKDKNGERDPLKTEIKTSAIRLKVARSSLWSVFRLALAILITLRIERVVTFSWWLVFLPLWLAVGMDILKQLFECRASPADGKSGSAEDGEGRKENTGDAALGEDETSSEPADRAAVAFVNLVFIAIWLSTAIVTVALIQSSLSFSAFYATIPMFVVVGLLLCCVCCQVFCMSDSSFSAPESPETPHNHADRSDSSVPYYGNKPKPTHADVDGLAMDNQV